jgi:hypothetical protein
VPDVYECNIFYAFALQYVYIIALFVLLAYDFLYLAETMSPLSIKLLKLPEVL